MYYDIASCKVPEWFGLKGIRPLEITAKDSRELKAKSRARGMIVLVRPSKEVFRTAVEKALVDAVLPDRTRGRDYFHHPRTLLNNVTAKLMSRNKVSLLFTFRELRDSKGIERALIWRRMKYETGICIKKDVPIMIASGAREEKDLVGRHSLLAFGELLGLSPDKAKSALYYAQEKILKRLNAT